MIEWLPSDLETRFEAKMFTPPEPRERKAESVSD